MEEAKYKAVWLSHSSIRDFLTCPRLYYLRSIYKDPITRHKISIVEPPLTLGGVVHDTIDSMSTLPTVERENFPLLKKFEAEWEKVRGKRGGFKTESQEKEYKEKGISMIQRVIDNIDPLLEKAVKIKEPLPNYWISKDENLLLSGKIDWLIYKPNDDSVHILDFKTGKHDEKGDSLQLPIYELVVINTQSRKVDGASYWYLDREDSPRAVTLPPTEETTEKVLTIGRRIKLARQLEHFECKTEGGCRYCAPYDLVLKGKAEKVGEGSYQDLYIIS